MSASSKPSPIAGGLTAGYRPTKKPAKKDRHSKIATAKGPRDRRMRLSLEVARKFFRLQDKLGFDKASKTVEWLMDRAWPEIKKLDIFSDDHQYPPNSGLKIGGSMSFSSDGECLTAECIVEQACGGDHEARSTIRTDPASLNNKKEAAVNINANQQKRTICLTIARESRAMARERARKRTREKLLQVMSKVQQYHSSMQLGSSAEYDDHRLQLEEVHDEYVNNIGCKPAAAASSSMIYSSAASRESRNYNYSSSTADDQFNYMENVHYGTSTDHDPSSFLESISNCSPLNILPNTITSYSTSTVPVVTSSCTNNYNTLINDEPAVFASRFCFGIDSLENLYTNILMGGRMNCSTGNL